MKEETIKKAEIIEFSRIGLQVNKLAKDTKNLIASPRSEKRVPGIVKPYHAIKF